MCRLEKTDLPDNNYQVGSTNITYAPVQAIRPTFLVEDTQDMKKYPQTLEAYLPADSAKLGVSESLSPDDLHSPIQGEEPDKNLSKAISKNKLTKVRHLQKLAAIVAIVAGIATTANNSVQLWQHWHTFKNSSASPALHDIKSRYQVK
ncbi:MAG: hypothetical protein JGK12_28805 [Microcoleus sp. PH2017_01_SCD_O_A]|nr:MULTISPECIES: hypothetical protein [unclassified Microcoleus]MCC3420316.1 hypothetical protein [Microcoleus sp. PH2017_07_MST_O_A]MCC3427805.1 hypothetical protein [Microcoleus sp. PH2017_01_SCD_O_A]MCC3438391.1 hypothetical protein [Microcoleus sp. PH2017_05_CCC_O_A]MCC3508588.1 hypothetical protein [Microcoleus sp. PH2017_17_BER_D_A]TAF94345.1 MAG: hypothetical protein EAZ45_27700 [Oscillatoriales cyanobacterium]